MATSTAIEAKPTTQQKRERRAEDRRTMTIETARMLLQTIIATAAAVVGVYVFFDSRLDDLAARDANMVTEVAVLRERIPPKIPPDWFKAEVDGLKVLMGRVADQLTLMDQRITRLEARHAIAEMED